MKRTPEQLRDFLFSRIEEICKLPHTVDDSRILVSLADGINKSIELQCRQEELKLKQKEQV